MCLWDSGRFRVDRGQGGQCAGVVVEETGVQDGGKEEAATAVA